MLLHTLPRSPRGSVIWCGLLPMQLSRCGRSHFGRIVDLGSRSRFCNRHKVGVVLQNLSATSTHGYPPYISAQQHSCNKKAPLSGGRGQVFKTPGQSSLFSIEILSSGAWILTVSTDSPITRPRESSTWLAVCSCPFFRA
jgi:hypothetical protein